MANGLSDTHPKIEQMLIERLRQMSPAQKLKAMVQLNQMARDLAVSDIRSQHPAASEDQVRRYLAERILGHELAEQVYGPIPGNIEVR